jgi:predicted nucleic acid-binding protein
VGSIVLPSSGTIYIDAQIIIYSVERHPVFSATLRPLWVDANAGRIRLCTSQLSIMECLVIPERTGDTALVAAFEHIFAAKGHVKSLPITAQILRAATKLRAAHRFIRTPDAIHAATALDCNADVLLTNDKAFDRLTGLKTLLLSP